MNVKNLKQTNNGITLIALVITIPKKFITFLEENCDENSSFTYNIALPIDKQNLSDDAKNILAVIYRLFWTDEKEKMELNELDKKIIQQNREKYNPENLFKKKLEQKNKSKQLIEYDKKNWLQKLFEKIKKRLIKR